MTEDSFFNPTRTWFSLKAGEEEYGFIVGYVAIDHAFIEAWEEGELDDSDIDDLIMRKLSDELKGEFKALSVHMMDFEEIEEFERILVHVPTAIVFK